MTLPAIPTTLGLGILHQIWCAIVGLAWAIVDAFVWGFNFFILVAAAAFLPLLDLFPDLPQVGGSLGGDVLQWANWLMPLTAIVSMFTAYLAVYIAARLIMAAVRMMDRLGITDTGR